MTTNNTTMFPNYKPEGYNIVKQENQSIIETKNQEIIQKIWNDVFLILHDFESESENKISKFLGEMREKYQHLVEWSKDFQEMDEYNLVDIFNEVHANLYYVWNNRSQLELIEKFHISSFDMLYKIIDTIGMSHWMHWKNIRMPVDKFSLLTQYVDHYQTKYFTQEDYLLMAQDLEYKNMEWLYSWLNALNLAEWIHRVDFWYDDTVQILMSTHKYIRKNIDGDDLLSQGDIKAIYENYYDKKTTNIHKHSYSSVKRLLSMFGYKIDDTEISLKAA